MHVFPWHVLPSTCLSTRVFIARQRPTFLFFTLPLPFSRLILQIFFPTPTTALCSSFTFLATPHPSSPNRSLPPHLLHIRPREQHCSMASYSPGNNSDSTSHRGLNLSHDHESDEVRTTIPALAFPASSTRALPICPRLVGYSVAGRRWKIFTSIRS